MKMAHVADYKKKVVDGFVKLIKEYPIVGAIDVEGMPTAQLQKMRETLRENDVVLLMSKRRIMKIALEKAKEEKKGIEELEKNLQGMPALIFSKVDSFKLYKLLKQSKSEAPAKPGQIAPKDIVVNAGKTNFLPGPIISELSGVGIKSGVEDGKVAIKEDCVVCKEGETINAQLAGLLTRLNIKPMEIGLNLVASFEKGVIFKRDVLDIDEEKFLSDITKAASESFNLSVEAGYITKENVDVIINNVFYSCKALAEESKFMADVVVEDMLAQAEQGAKSLQAEAKVEVTQAKEEPKAEEKPSAVEKPKEEKPPEEVETPAEKKEEELLEKEKEIIEEEKKLEEPKDEEKPAVEKEVEEAVKEEEEKKLEKERIDTEKEIEKVEKEKEPTTDEKIAKMVQSQQKHASGEDKKESAEALIEEVESKVDKEKKEIEEVENIVDQLKKGKSIKPQEDDKVPSAAELAAKKQKESQD
ncbi:50S ribosomal protein L10 [Candidatus Woesearchaeota archaeon B3_Woes]|nr:MAG: 50S ribosomal protein L10 [Candidatus Woesearchaeota archaeon B3_Woes]